MHVTGNYYYLIMFFTQFQDFHPYFTCKTCKMHHLIKLKLYQLGVVCAT